VVVIFVLFARAKFTDHALTTFICVIVEAIALLSWTAGFVAVAVNIGTQACPVESCRLLRTAVVFGAFEWLLFVITTSMTAMLARGSSRWGKHPANSSAMALRPVV